MARKKQLVGTLDTETDPFLYGRVPEPFAVGIYFETGEYKDFWGDWCIEDSVEYLRQLPPTKLYTHNGGKFDFFFYLSYADAKIQVIKNRIVKIKIGNCTIIDSYACIPVPLGAYQKTKIDYKKFERDQRDKPRNKRNIQRYLFDDCKYLFELVTGFKSIVGVDRLTVGGTAFAILKKMGYPIPDSRMPTYNDLEYDTKLRPYFFGGRCETHRVGVFDTNFTYIDINSAYPDVMCNVEHAINLKKSTSGTSARVMELHSLCHVRAISHGVLPLRTKKGLFFPSSNTPGNFYCTGHEIIAGLKTGRLEILEYYDVTTSHDTINFKEYVEKYYNLKNNAKKCREQIAELTYKTLLNAGFGKWASDPRDYKNYELGEWDKKPDDYHKWEPVCDWGSITIWEHDLPVHEDMGGFFDVAVGASITGAVRANLFTAMTKCEGLFYNDTDSIIAEKVGKGLKMGDKLGQWSIEGKGDKIAVAGKKLYAVRLFKNGKNKKDGYEWKTASKGVNLEYDEIVDIAGGKDIINTSDVFGFSIKNEKGVSSPYSQKTYRGTFQERKVTRTKLEATQ